MNATPTISIYGCNHRSGASIVFVHRTNLGVDAGAGQKYYLGGGANPDW